MSSLEPGLNAMKITDLRPTQIALGMNEVEERVRRWKTKAGKKAATYLASHMVPVVAGPKDRHYIIDHHHLVRALHESGLKEVLVSVVADLSDLDVDSFWFNMDCRGWLHPFDQNGRRRSYKDLPASIDAMVDDPYRSLAGELRRVGGYAKDTMPFSEFLWADFLRSRIKRKAIRENYNHALEHALQLAKSAGASYLPGWCGPAPDVV